MGSERTIAGLSPWLPNSSSSTFSSRSLWPRMSPSAWETWERSQEELHRQRSMEMLLMMTEPYAQAGGTPYDATRTGPLCSQAGLDSELIEGLKTKTVKEMLIETLPEGLIPDILMGLFVPALLD